MRIAMVATWLPTKVNPGSGIFVARDAAALAALGHQVQLIHLVAPALDDGRERTYTLGVPTLRVPLKVSNPASLARARARLEQLTAGADVVHTQAISALFPYMLRRPAQPWVHTEHWSGATSTYTNPFMRRGVHTLLNAQALPDTVTAVSNFLANHLRPYRHGKPLVVVPNQVVRPQTLTPPPRSLHPGAPLKLVGVGGLIERKGPLLALQILHQLSGLGLKAKLTWAGSGPLLEQCREQAAALGVDATFLGQVPAEQIPQLISDSDMFLVPTIGETFFLGAAEAIAAGRPVVTGSYGGHTDFLDPAVCALVSGRDPLVWAQALKQLAQRTAAYCAQEVAATLPDAFSAPQVAKRYVQVYQDTIAAR